jgi:hypothetical protein
MVRAAVLALAGRAAAGDGATAASASGTVIAATAATSMRCLIGEQVPVTRAALRPHPPGRGTVAAAP